MVERVQIKDEGRCFKVLVNDEVLKFFDRARIYCADQKGKRPRRWKVGDKITIHKETVAEPYITFREGWNVLNFGAFSYTVSPLPLDIKVGRYCSIAKNVEVFGWSHPAGAVSTSLMVCDKEVR